MKHWSLLKNYYDYVNEYVNEQFRRINKRCTRNNILPRSLIQHLQYVHPWNNGRLLITANNGKRFLTCYIQDGYRKLRLTNKQIDLSRSELLSKIPWYLENEVEETELKKNQLQKQLKTTPHGKI